MFTHRAEQEMGWSFHCSFLTTWWTPTGEQLGELQLGTHVLGFLEQRPMSFWDLEAMSNIFSDLGWVSVDSATFWASQCSLVFNSVTIFSFSFLQSENGDGRSSYTYILWKILSSGNQGRRLKWARWKMSSV